MKISEIQAFTCPKWEDLPSEPLFNREVVTYINDLLKPIFMEEVPLTTTMVQNYSKWQLIPEIVGRKYGRDQIAILIIITIFKQVLSTEDLKTGMSLQLRLMPLNEAYDIFARAITLAIQATFKDVEGNRALKLSAQEIIPRTEGIQVIANAFAQKLLGQLIIKTEGYQHIGGTS